MAYKYTKGVFEVTTPIRDGFKRFHKCNAQYKIETFLFDDEMTVRGARTQTRYAFISYNTPMVYALYDNKYDNWFVCVNDNIDNYSKSTSRQLDRFFGEYGIPLNVLNIKVALRRDVASSIFFPSCDYFLNNCYFLEDTETLNRKVSF